MPTRGTKFPVEKPYLKVDRSIASISSSSGNVDLSYSYSCLEAFKQNQHIIGELAAVHNRARFSGLSHQPATFTLTGDREKPIYQPFYYSTLSEHNESEDRLQDTNRSSTDKSHQFTESVKSEFIRPLGNQNKSYREDFIRDHHPSYETEFPDLQVLVQWLKYQFKYIYYFWPFTKTNCNFITDWCKRNRKMKMEMLLNNLDENTKLKLKQCVADMNLNMEERYSLCNESIIEIDISPIVEYPERLQAFLVFLRSIEVGNSTAVEQVDSKGTEMKRIIENQSGSKNHTNISENTNASDIVEHKTHSKRMNKQSNNFHKKVKYKVITNENCCKPLPKDTFGNGTCKNDAKNKFEETKIANYRVSFEHSARPNEESNLQNKFLINKCQIKRNFPDQKTMNLTVDDTNLRFENTTKSIHHTKVLNSSLFQHHNIENTDNLHGKQALVPENNFSCKCLLHEDREDYVRYKNQCLLGKGDEGSNRFLKYVMDNKISENKCLSNFCQKGSVKTKNDVFQMESADDDYPSVTKLVCKDKVKKESQTKPRLHNYIADKGKFHKLNRQNMLSSSKSSNQKRGNDKLETIKFPHPRDVCNDLIYYSRDSMLDNKNNVDEYCKSGEEDIETLVCAVNLSRQSSASDLLKGLTGKSNDNQNIKDFNYKQEEFNACFESLDYSINSYSTNNEENISLKTNIPNGNETKPENTTSRISLVSNNHSISTRNLSGIRDIDNCEVNSSSNSGYGSFHYNDKENNNCRFEVAPFKYYDSKCTMSNNANASLNLDKNSIRNKVKVSQNQIHALIKNANELENNVILLNEGISQLNTRQNFRDCRQEKIYNTDEQETNKLNKRSFLIRINNDDTHRVSEPSQVSTNKKHLKLNSLNPKNIYRSISSIFRGNRAKYQEDNGNMNNKTSSLKCNKKLLSGNRHYGKAEINFTNDNINESLTPKISNVSENDSELLLKCLEQLYVQLKKQKKEIKEMKRLMNNHV